MDMTSTFAPISKTIDQDDGSLMVYGKATDDSLDLDEQRCDAGWLSQAMPAWFGSGHGGVGGNIRAQHRADSAVGKAIEHEAAADGHYITAKIVDREAIAKTKAGVFTGFSIGIRRPKIIKSDLAPNGLINGGTITEISLVDRPANSNAVLTLCKAATEGWEGAAADLDTERGLVKCEELIVEKAAEPVETDEQAQDVADELLDAAKGAPDTVEITVSDEFDRDAAKALVTETLAKADDEQSDIAGAQSAIAIIAKLIASEASELAENAGEACDIQLLLEAVSALRCFQGREQAEQGGGGNEMVLLAAEIDAEKAKYNAEQLREMLAAGKAMKNPNGDPSYPIGDAEDLDNAIHAVGRGKGDHSAIRAHIIKNAERLHLTNKIPGDWVGLTKSVDNEETPVTSTEMTEPETDLTKAPEADSVEPEVELTKVDGFTPDVLVKAFTDAFAEEDSALRKMFVDIVEASTKATVQTLGDLGKRVAQVEQMATPGGPSLRRTEADRNQARRTDLVMEAARYKALATAAEDMDLRRGYATKAAQLEAQVKALV